MNAGADMGSSRPYLLRAIYQWIVDNDCTPYLMVDASRQGVQVPAQAIRDGKVVLNMAPQAIVNLDMGNRELAFLTRFSGVSMQVRVPVSAITALYAQETGQGMMFQDEDPVASHQQGTRPDAPNAVPEDQAPAERGSRETSASADEHGKPRKGAPHLRVIK